jgi:glycosyltransferase involved in cell wall biosynthesis
LESEEQFGRPSLKRKPIASPQPGESGAPEVQHESVPQTSSAQPETSAIKPVEVPKTEEKATGEKPQIRQERPPRPSNRRDRDSSDSRPPRQQSRGRGDNRPRPERNEKRVEKPARIERPQPAKPFRADNLKLSVVIPAFNEEGNIVPLLEQFNALFASLPYRSEMIIVDDGSTDKTPIRIREGQLRYPWLKSYVHRHNMGLTSALETGFGKAAGKIIIFYPADMQYHANEIPKFVAKIDAGADVVTGWKQGNYGLKSIASFFYNAFSRILFKVKVHDLNSIKAFKKEVAECFSYRRGWHRYIVVMAAGAGYKIDEVRVRLFPRKSGRSKFGFWRLPAGFLDLLSVKFQLSFTTKPLLFFGSAGLISGTLGFFVGLAAIYLRVIKHEGFRPLLYLVILLIVSGLLLFFGGFLAELIVSVGDDVKKRKNNQLT